MDYTKYFKVSKRINGDYYVFISDEAPEKLKTLIFDIHKLFSALPNDWIYKIIVEALEDLEKDALDIINIEADDNYSDLCKWFYDNCSFANDLSDEVISEGLCTPKNAIDLIACAQRFAKTRIYVAVNKFFRGGGINNE